jgi:hypothetical protein
MLPVAFGGFYTNRETRFPEHTENLMSSFRIITTGQDEDGLYIGNSLAEALFEAREMRQQEILDQCENDYLEPDGDYFSIAETYDDVEYEEEPIIQPTHSDLLRENERLREKITSLGRRLAEEEERTRKITRLTDDVGNVRDMVNHRLDAIALMCEQIIASSNDQHQRGALRMVWFLVQQTVDDMDYFLADYVVYGGTNDNNNSPEL